MRCTNAFGSTDIIGPPPPAVVVENGRQHGAEHTYKVSWGLCTSCYHNKNSHASHVSHGTHVIRQHDSSQAGLLGVADALFVTYI